MFNLTGVQRGRNAPVNAGAAIAILTRWEPEVAGPMRPRRPSAVPQCAQRLKRMFGIDIEIYAACGGTMRIIAGIEDPVVIKAILAHLAGKAPVVSSLAIQHVPH